MDMLYANRFTAAEYPELELDGYDGPYLSLFNNSIHLLQVNGRCDINIEIFNQSTPSFDCTVDNEDEDRFAFSIYRHNSQVAKSSKFEPSSSIMVISDIEGNFNALYTLLLTNKVMNL